MTPNVFQSVIERLYGRFEKRMPLDAVKDDAWESVKGIPDEAVPWILSRLLDMESFPRNWVRDFRSLWASWLQAHPEKRAHEDRGCHKCTGGELHAVMIYPSARMAYTAACPCGHCQPALGSSRTQEQLERAGYVVFRHGADAADYAKRYVHEARGIEQINGRLCFQAVLTQHRRAA